MLIVLYLLVAVAVLFVAAAVATRDVDGLADAPPDRADVGLLEGPVEAEDVAELRFDMVLRGYRMSEVDDALARLAGALSVRDHRIAELTHALAEAVEPVLVEAEARAVHPTAVAPGPVHPVSPIATEPEPEPARRTDVLLPPPPPDVSVLPPAAAFTAAPPASGPTSAVTTSLGASSVLFGTPLASKPVADEPEPVAVEPEPVAVAGDPDPPMGPPAEAGPAQDPDDDLFPEVLSAEPAAEGLPDAGDSWDLPEVQDAWPASDVPAEDSAGEDSPRA